MNDTSGSIPLSLSRPTLTERSSEQLLVPEHTANTSSEENPTSLLPPTAPDCPALNHLPLIELRWRPCWDPRYRRYYFWDTITNTSTWHAPVPTPLQLPDLPPALLPSVPSSVPAASPSSQSTRGGEREQDYDAQQKQDAISLTSGEKSLELTGGPDREQDENTRMGISAQQSSFNDVNSVEISNAETTDDSSRVKKKRKLNSKDASSMPLESQSRKENGPTNKLSPISPSLANPVGTIASSPNDPSPPSTPLPPLPTLNLQTHQQPAYFHPSYQYPPPISTESHYAHILPNLPVFTIGLASNDTAYPSTSPPLYTVRGGIPVDDGQVRGGPCNEVGGNEGVARKGSEDGLFHCTHSSCTKSFTRLYNLKSHLRTHTNDRPFQCDQCPLAFTRNHDLRRHKKVHSGDKPFRCEGCGRQFGRMDALSRHRGNRSTCQQQGDEPTDSKLNVSFYKVDDTRARSRSQPVSENVPLYETAIPSPPQHERQMQHQQPEAGSEPTQILFDPNQEGHPSPQQSHTHPHLTPHSPQPHLHQPPARIPPEPQRAQPSSMLVAVGYEDPVTRNKDLQLLEQLHAQHEEHQKQLQGNRERQPQFPQQSTNLSRSQNTESSPARFPSPPDSAQFEFDESRELNAVKSPQIAAPESNEENRQGNDTRTLSAQPGEILSRLLSTRTVQDGCMDLSGL